MDVPFTSRGARVDFATTAACKAAGSTAA